MKPTILEIILHNMNILKKKRDDFKGTRYHSVSTKANVLTTTCASISKY